MVPVIKNESPAVPIAERWITLHKKKRDYEMQGMKR
jgi:hypothetical protein